jgi:pimeloyl-ACP methyl ester carboxylesterase
VAELVTDDVTLHVEVDGDGSPTSVLAHGLTNSCRELARLTPFLPGTKVRFCFRGHGHSSSPLTGYRFADFARDLEAVADAYGAEVACGTSLGAGALCSLLARKPDRFDKIVMLLPAGLDRPFGLKDRLLKTATMIDGKSVAEAVRTLLDDPERAENYERFPFLRDLDEENLATLNPVGIPRAIREIVNDWPLEDRDQMRAVTAPTLLIARRGDDIHPAIVAEILADIMPNAELMMFEDGESMFRGIPAILAKVNEFLRA